MKLMLFETFLGN